MRRKDEEKNRDEKEKVRNVKRKEEEFEKRWRMKNIDEKKNMGNGKESWRNESQFGMERWEW